MYAPDAEGRFQPHFPDITQLRQVKVMPSSPMTPTCTFPWRCPFLRFQMLLPRHLAAFVFTLAAVPTQTPNQPDAHPTAARGMPSWMAHERPGRCAPAQAGGRALNELSSRRCSSPPAAKPRAIASICARPQI